MRLLLPLLTLLLLISCQNETAEERDRKLNSLGEASDGKSKMQIKQEPDESKEAEKDSSVQSKLREVAEDKPASESFMAFFEDFMWDEEYQKSRIEFPLIFNERVIDSANEWEHKGFYATKTFIPILHTDSTTYYEKDIAAADAKMSVVSFENQQVENFFFSKQNNHWLLNEVNLDSIEALADVDFIRFLERFSTDTSYQLAHIHFPIPNYYADYDKDYETVYDSISMEDWKHVNVVEGIKGLMTLNTGINSNIREIFFRGVENGIKAYYYFLKVEGEWKLVKLEDYST